MGSSCTRLGEGPQPADVISPEDVQKGHRELLDTCQGTELEGKNTAAEDLTPAPSVVIAPPPADGISPEDVQKGQNLELLDTCQGTDFGAENTATDDLTPAPSVVIAWVLREVAEWSGPYLWEITEEEKMKRELQLAAHAARLLECWESHQKEFPEAFAEELSVLGGRIVFYDKQLQQFATFLLRLFGAYRNPERKDLHIAIGSQELWPLVLAEFRRQQAAFEGAQPAAPASYRWLLGLLHELDRSSPGDYCSTKSTKIVNKAVKKLEAELLKVHAKAIVMEREAAELQRAQQRAAEWAARDARVKASVKKAPWDKGA
ncbi:hypothetical protein KFL_002670080 [Klebsormidium nitens]|uniref:Uncharacterized protein n=1 Tax=Klebsormidium nitens TaxID=105231 RepID=A0A1Y1ID89_KLENI|nr:hypothetical protein KFL_002670080 [Klebsormidium nitens]|eukprot:GAQ86048.1 hypothetical protein KFL_002670080 [Klebsormidium nitens]